MGSVSSREAARIRTRQAADANDFAVTTRSTIAWVVFAECAGPSRSLAEETNYTRSPANDYTYQDVAQRLQKLAERAC